MSSVSVIVPTWNRADMIKKAVQSAINQTYPPLEILVCDDGSIDNTEKIINSLNDPRVIWVKGSHSGSPAITRNRGILKCKGEWIAFLDSDDEWLPKKLQKQIELAYKLGCKAICSNAYRLLPERGIVGTLLTWNKEIIMLDDLLNCNQVICSSVMIHRSLFEKTNGFPEDTKVIEDYALWLRIAIMSDFAFVNEPLVIYRDDAVNSIRSKVISDELLQRKYIFNDFLNWAKNYRSINKSYHHFIQKVRREYWKTIFNLWIRKIRNFLSMNINN